MSKKLPGSLEIQRAFALQQGTKNSAVVDLMMRKQDQMVEWGWISIEDLKHRNQWHLMSAELVIADLLRKLENYEANLPGL